MKSKQIEKQIYRLNLTNSLNDCMQQFPTKIMIDIIKEKTKQSKIYIYTYKVHIFIWSNELDNFISAIE